jgi:hypothetical protein
MKPTVKSQQNASGPSQLTTPSTTKQNTPTPAQKGSSSLVGNAVHVTPIQPTPVTSQTVTKPTPVAKAQHKTGGYYSKIAAIMYDRIDSNNSSSDSDSDSDSDDSSSEEWFLASKSKRSQRVKNGRHPKKS